MVNVSGICFNENAIRNARQKEQAQNRNNTLKNVALIAAAPVVTKLAAQNLNPAVKNAIVDAAANGIRGVRNLIHKSIRSSFKSIYETKSGHKLINFISDLNFKWECSKLYKALDNWGRNSKFWQKNIHDPGIKLFEKLGTNKGLIKFAGVGLLAYGALKTVQNYYENKGAIKEKYNV